MKRLFSSIALPLLLAGTTLAEPAPADTPAIGGDTVCGDAVCGDYGTSVTFAASPAAAARQATAEEKLVFLLHVSGNFEFAQYT